MTSYEDLSRYVYSPCDVPMLNVGWLGDGSYFPTGPSDPRVRMELLKRAADPANVMRGFHHCELCDQESPIRIDAVDGVHGRVLLGTGEIHVVGRDGLTFAAPTLIIHYIDRHSYEPPEKFVAALLEGW